MALLAILTARRKIATGANCKPLDKYGHRPEEENEEGEN